ncbi:unnamed protein product [marine sediment metagenome]|uniref:Uncharacterized protein n=1 Tax=marine sediment metagenome TaxID=412755 RepID=X1FVK7_9ZZZZ
MKFIKVIMKKISYKLTFKKSYILVECIVLFSLIILTCINLVGCESLKKALEGPKPEPVVGSFFKSLINKDYSKAYSYLCEENKSKFSSNEFIDKMQDFQEIIRYEILSSNVGYKNSKVTVNLTTLSYDEEEIKEIEVPLIKEEDEWRIVFFDIEFEK